MLKLKPLVLLLTLGSFLNIKAQHGFNINLPIGTDTIVDIGNKVIELNNQQFLSCGISIGYMINYTASYLVKTTSNGDLIWKKQYDFSTGNYDSFTDLLQLPDSNYLLIGTTTNTTTGDYDVFLTKIDTSGSIIWYKQYLHTDYDQGAELKLTPDGKVIIVGRAESVGVYNDVLLIKTDLDGNLIWRKRFGNSFDEKYYSIEIIKNNTEYLLGGDYGYYSSGDPYFDMSLMRTDTAGNIIWQQQYGISPNESGKCAIPTLDSGYAICGMYNDTGSVLKTDKNGVVQWIKKFSQQQGTLYSMKQLQDSSYVIIKSDIDTQNANRTGFLTKADKNGNVIWERIYPHPTSGISNYFFGFNTTADKGFIITGQYNRIGQPYQNMWLVKTDSLGCDSVTCSYLTGIEEQHRVTQTIKLIPNPNDGNFTLFLDKEVQDLSLIVYDVTGKEVCSNAISNTNNIQLNCTDLKNGIYIVKVFSNSVYIQSHKLVIQK